MNRVTQLSSNHLPDKNPETVEKDVRKWVESICEFKTNLEMEKCEMPSKKASNKARKLKVKKKMSLHSIRGEEKKKKSKGEHKVAKAKPGHKSSLKEKVSKDSHLSPIASTFENLKDHYKNAKLPPNWISGQSRGRLVFCRVKVISHGSQYEMVSDRGVAITNDCRVHVFIDGPEILLHNWKMQRVETVEDIRRTIKAVDGFVICSGALPSGIKSPSCSIFLTGDAKTCQACKSEMARLNVPGIKMKSNSKTAPKPGLHKNKQLKEINPF